LLLSLGYWFRNPKSNKEDNEVATAAE